MTLKSFYTRDSTDGVLGLFADRRVSYSLNTRVAIRKACDTLQLGPGDEILVPDYNCGSEADPLRHAGLKVTLYPVDRQARIHLDELEKRISPETRAIYLIQYFGFQHPNGTEIRELCDRHGLFLIEDCALSLLSGDKPVAGRLGDISVFCFYKFFPVMAGGALVVNNEDINGDTQFVRPPPASFIMKNLLRGVFYFLLGQDNATNLLARLRPSNATDHMPGKQEIVERPDMPPHYYFDQRFLDARISRFASLPLRSFNVSEIINTRRENYQLYLDVLSGIQGASPLFPSLDDQDCPLSIPILVQHRDALAAALAADGIPATSWWSGYNQHLDWVDYEDARLLKESVLSLPVHQNLGDTEIRHIASQLSKHIQSLGTSDYV
ncbi:DegT/DnrJ/EryC1/StrS family aminotransferase (plasmid) [Aliiroseovarius sp. M344]|uniref:DegT/DnrJ/EryC1/StrS family aminotransferase n=1 Tax=Aliiroseovarius sp. M344 TaxID=2867010 RepID=UPI0021AD55FD|nr:DegT/DnrJ/EryC1/StrS family aminotransferase [Aliiroseovarius sp. M344]UWQ16080.1 DegT/DnrJ/EryC1/StrS family aminotransferase [Aliiroseovarius sp. M344]